ncbi:MAG: class I SAM-dependent methyltransferase [Myxococcales bacterium]|nr:class I SAM-dependent methyltransferase [Myxococcales bacterium]
MIPDSYFERFSTKKYRNENPIQRALIRRFVERLHGLFIAAQPIESVLEVGCGEGFLSGYLSEKFPHIRFSGVDLDPGDVENLRAKFPRIDAHVGSAYDLSSFEGQTFDLVICAEVLEHLERPDAALEQILDRRPKSVILTVPHEPFFMLSNLARGKNVTRFGNDPEHINHFGKAAFRRLLEPRIEIEALTTAYPWLLCLGHPR